MAMCCIIEKESSIRLVKNKQALLYGSSSSSMSRAYLVTQDIGYPCLTTRHKGNKIQGTQVEKPAEGTKHICGFLKSIYLTR